MAATAKYKKTTTTVKGGGKRKDTEGKNKKGVRICPNCGKPM